MVGPIVLGLAGVALTVSLIWVAVDAATNRMPWAWLWVLGCLAFWPVILPAYVYRRTCWAGFPDAANKAWWRALLLCQALVVVAYTAACSTA